MSTILPLQHPFTYANETISSLEVHRPKVADLRVMDQTKGDLAKEIALLARLTRLPEKAIDLLDGEDFASATQMVAAYLGKSPETGKTS